MIQFYSPDIESTGILPPEDSMHCVRVLRRREGDTISVVDGAGHRFGCRIAGADPRAVAVDIETIETVPPHWGCRITLAVAPTKNIDRMEWMVEKAVEIGVDRIVPLLCAHSERKVLKTDRLRKIAISAMKQSLKATLPRIDELTPIAGFLAEEQGGMKFMGYCDKEYPRLSLAREYAAASADSASEGTASDGLCGAPDVTVLVGPEGDFSPEEVEAAVRAGYVPATFGQSRLRTETACIAALQTIHTVNDLRRCPDLDTLNIYSP